VLKYSTILQSCIVCDLKENGTLLRVVGAVPCSMSEGRLRPFRGCRALVTGHEISRRESIPSAATQFARDQPARVRLPLPHCTSSASTFFQVFSFVSVAVTYTIDVWVVASPILLVSGLRSAVKWCSAVHSSRDGRGQLPRHRMGYVAVTSH